MIGKHNFTFAVTKVLSQRCFATSASNADSGSAVSAILAHGFAMRGVAPFWFHPQCPPAARVGGGRCRAGFATGAALPPAPAYEFDQRIAR